MWKCKSLSNHSDKSKRGFTRCDTCQTFTQNFKHTHLIRRVVFSWQGIFVVVAVASPRHFSLKLGHLFPLALKPMFNFAVALVEYVCGVAIHSECQFDVSNTGQFLSSKVHDPLMPLHFEHVQAYCHTHWHTENSFSVLVQKKVLQNYAITQ